MELGRVWAAHLDDVWGAMSGGDLAETLVSMLAGELGRGWAAHLDAEWGAMSGRKLAETLVSMMAGELGRGRAAQLDVMKAGVLVMAYKMSFPSRSENSPQDNSSNLQMM